ncbi:MAG: hypothetical protein ACK4YP_25385 [Myxococcota bacterium]
MKKFLAALALGLGLSTPASAGIGTTAGIGSSGSGELTFVAPTLDYRGGGVLVQLHALDLIGKLPNKYLDLGVGVSGIAFKRKVGADVEGVIMPGGVARIYTDTGFNALSWNVGAQARFGAEMKQGFGFGVYVVPMLGVSNFSGKVGPSYGGTLQVSAWIMNK